MNRDELEQLARDVAENARHRARIVFQVKHPHYTPPPGAGVGNDEVLAIAHDRAKRLYDSVGQFYSRGSVWSSLGWYLDREIARLERDAIATNTQAGKTRGT